MVWKIKFDSTVEKDLRGLDKQAQKRILVYLRDKLGQSENPRVHGAPLQGKLNNLWKYRVGNYRIICQIEDNEMTVLVVRVGHRKHIYKKFSK